MTDAEKREKVIRGLEICTKPGSCSECCPYYHIEITEGSCDYFLLTDALSLLKEQKARVMTKSEAEQYTNGEEKYEYSDKPPLYIEHKKAQPFYIKWATLEVVCAWMKDLNMKQEYGKTFRFWTSRPLPEQMRETKWEGEGIK